MSRIKFNPEISLGNIAQIGSIIVAVVVFIVRVEVREVRQEHRIQNNENRIVVVEGVNEKQNEALVEITKLVTRLEERSNNAR